MGISVDGNSITIDNCTITINNAFDPTTGTASITITPAGGLGTLPALLDGRPGPPPLFQAGTTTTLASGESATVAFDLLAPGGPGTPSLYVVNVGVPAGETGPDTFVSYIQGGIEALINGATLIWDSTLSLLIPTVVSPPAAVTLYASSIVSTSGSGAGPRELTSITFGAQSFPWTPQPAASCVVNGTVNTQVTLQAFVGSTSGPQVGIGYGVPDLATQTIALGPGAPTGSSASYGVIPAGTEATILLCATQVAATDDDWSTAAATTSFQVTAQPVQS